MSFGGHLIQSGQYKETSARTPCGASAHFPHADPVTDGVKSAILRIGEVPPRWQNLKRVWSTRQE